MSAALKLCRKTKGRWGLRDFLGKIGKVHFFVVLICQGSFPDLVFELRSFPSILYSGFLW